MTACAAKFSNKGDLLVGERSHLLANGGDDAEQHVILAQGHDQEGTEADLKGDAQSWIVRLLASALPDIGDMDEPLAFEHADKRVARAGPKAIPNQLAELYRRRVLCCNPPKKFAVIGKQRTAFSAAQTVRLIQDRVKYRRQVARRGIDDTQHLSRRGLLLQRLAGFVDQPRVLHCDDRLGGEILQQRDLLVGERTHLLAIDVDRADHIAVSEQRDRQQCADAAKLYQFAGYLAGSVAAGDIGNMNKALARGQLTERCIWFGPSRLAHDKFGKLWRDAAQCGGAIRIAVQCPQHPERGFAQPHGLFEHCVEHRRKIAGRGVDDLQYLGSGGLPLQRLARLAD